MPFLCRATLSSLKEVGTQLVSTSVYIVLCPTEQLTKLLPNETEKKACRPLCLATSSFFSFYLTFVVVVSCSLIPAFSGSELSSWDVQSYLLDICRKAVMSNYSAFFFIVLGGILSECVYLAAMYNIQARRNKRIPLSSSYNLQKLICSQNQYRLQNGLSLRQIQYFLWPRKLLPPMKKIYKFIQCWQPGQNYSLFCVCVWSIHFSASGWLTALWKLMVGRATEQVFDWRTKKSLSSSLHNVFSLHLTFSQQKYLMDIYRGMDC